MRQRSSIGWTIKPWPKRLDHYIPRDISTGRDAPLGDTERDKLLKHVAALSLLLMEKSNKYKLGEQPNANQIAKAVQAILDALPEENNRRGTGESNIRESISAGLKLLNT